MTLLLRLVVVILPTVAFVPAAEAEPIVYFYQGNPLETTGVYQCPPVCSISGSFTLASELEANRPIELPLTPLWFSFSNGLDTATPASVTSGGGALFHVSTDADGAIEEWVIQLALQSTTTSYIRTWNTHRAFTLTFLPTDKIRSTPPIGHSRPPAQRQSVAQSESPSIRTTQEHGHRTSPSSRPRCPSRAACCCSELAPCLPPEQRGASGRLSRQKPRSRESRVQALEEKFRPL